MQKHLPRVTHDKNLKRGDVRQIKIKIKALKHNLSLNHLNINHLNTHQVTITTKPILSPNPFLIDSDYMDDKTTRTPPLAPRTTWAEKKSSRKLVATLNVTISTKIATPTSSHHLIKLSMSSIHCKLFSSSSTHSNQFNQKQSFIQSYL